MSLALERLSFAYEGGPIILDDASLVIEQGTYCLVRGPSGAGKSTLLRLLCLLEEPQSGHVVINGTATDAMVPAQLRRNVAYVQQMPTLLPGTVRENLLLPFSFKSNEGLLQPTDEVLLSYLSSFLLDCITLETRADTLSVGQSQRVCLIRSLLLEPEVILMDEPTASLDADSARVVLDKAAELAASGMTVIMISHSEVTPPGVTHTIRINAGKLEYAS
ncbi:ATP-binding cassette domain-containing protein [Pseudodesulfovibrio sp. zrk46]|uniref:ABC transporter ATP-binding protein n=1 Tax=Pseudodesulfovibrio sp. zrk46 TaxID=2725288 RepID=UPI001449A49D|nr:ATP-binding cassette domain-containing protein [Pseudodesulfovibrio sp. zrk46]QJB56397.1 ATP-binding cassette domain-containing protein [Pseudodesulfovibrio sp. zrk46]